MRRVMVSCTSRLYKGGPCSWVGYRQEATAEASPCPACGGRVAAEYTPCRRHDWKPMLVAEGKFDRCTKCGVERDRPVGGGIPWPSSPPDDCNCGSAHCSVCIARRGNAARAKRDADRMIAAKRGRRG